MRFHGINIPSLQDYKSKGGAEPKPEGEGKIRV